MKFSDRSAPERTAIDAWIRLAVHVREQAYLAVAEDFRDVRRKTISELPVDLEKMLRFYRAYQHGHHSVSYTDYFRVSNPEEYAAILATERVL